MIIIPTGQALAFCLALWWAIHMCFGKLLNELLIYFQQLSQAQLMLKLEWHCLVSSCFFLVFFICLIRNVRDLLSLTRCGQVWDTMCSQSWYKMWNMNSIIYIICATGFFKKDHYLVSNTVQYNLNTMGRIPYDDCILISEIKKDSVQFSMWWV